MPHVKMKYGLGKIRSNLNWRVWLFFPTISVNFYHIVLSNSWMNIMENVKLYFFTINMLQIYDAIEKNNSFRNSFVLSM